MTKRSMPKIAFITAETPFGKSETFILDELLEIQKKNPNIIVIPRSPPRAIFHKSGYELLKSTIRIPVFNMRIIFEFLKAIFEKKNREVIKSVLMQTDTIKKRIKNFLILPKAIFVSKIIGKQNICHIHAHWGSTTATIAYIVSRLTDIPWSMTLHRWDIAENNLLKEKVKTCKFVRCISKHGEKELLIILNNESKNKIHVLHMGASIPQKQTKISLKNKIFTIVTPAHLYPVKGHKYLIEACQTLIEKGVENFIMIFYGDGHLRETLKNDIYSRNLQKHIIIPGAIEHTKLIALYESNKIDLVILPSITTVDNEHEGIPVSLIEAIAHKIPVISTKTGGIPELLSVKETLIEEKSSQELAQSIINMMQNNKLRDRTTEINLQKVEAKFNIDKITNELLNLITAK